MAVNKIVITSSFGGLGTIDDAFRDKLTVTEQGYRYSISYPVEHGFYKAKNENLSYETDSDLYKQKYRKLCKSFEKEAEKALELFFCDALPSEITLYYDDGRTVSFDALPDILYDIKSELESTMLPRIIESI